MDALANSPLAILVGGGLLLAVILLGRRIDVRLGSVHAQLRPNGGSSLRDAVDRIEAKADDAIERIERLEAVPQPPPVAVAVMNAPRAAEAGRS